MPFDGDPLGFCGKLIVEARDASLLEALKNQLSHSEDSIAPTIHPRTKRSIHPTTQSRTEDTVTPTIYPKDTIAPITFDPDLLIISDDNLAHLLNKKVGILGAGIGGLYTALMLDSIDVDYEILEASGRVGGRLETHKFKGGGEYDYYDAGAMRYPLPKKEDGKYKNGIMARLGDLIDYPPLNEGPDKLQDQLRVYYYKARNEKPGDKPGFYYFNGVHQSVDGPKDPSGFRADEMGVGPEYIKAGYDRIQSDVLNPFARGLIKDLETGSKDGWAVMLENDAYSVRGYMATRYLPSYDLNLPPRPLPMNTVNWINLLETGTSRYDRALTEAVFSAMEFANFGNTDYGDVEWKCFEGGSETLSKRIASYLQKKNEGSVRLDQKVTAIKKTFTYYSIPKDYVGREIPDTAKRTEKDGVVWIEIDGASHEREVVRYPTMKVTANNASIPQYHYGHVISTLPLPVLRTLDLKEADLNILQQNALRALDYGFSVKIALRFKSPWWTDKLGITGGQSFTDLPIRTIVYPSYGVNSNAPSNVLIASYSWSSDASRLAALAASEDKSDLKELVLRNLAEAHNRVNGYEGITYEYLKGELADGENIHVKDWNSDKYTMGTFANFSPGEFGDLYSSLTVPAADGCLHFVGEAVSTRHRWVVGALDSAWRAVHEYLKLTKQAEKLKEFHKLWKGNSEWISPSTLFSSAAESEHDLLDEHVALLRKAILAGVAGP